MAKKTPQRTATTKNTASICLLPSTSSLSSPLSFMGDVSHVSCFVFAGANGCGNQERGDQGEWDCGNYRGAETYLASGVGGSDEVKGAEEERRRGSRCEDAAGGKAGFPGEESEACDDQRGSFYCYRKRRE